MRTIQTMKLWNGRSDPEREQRGERAAQLLRDELLLEALDAIEEGCVERWKLAGTTEARESEWRQLNAARNVRNTLALIVQRGKEAATKRTLAEKAKDAARQLRRAS